MKLYYSAGSCSTSCHIVLEESGLPYEAVQIDWDNPQDSDLVEKLNPLGTLPILLTDDGKQLDQNASIQAYVAEKAPDKKLLPPAGTLERAQALNWLSFVAADLHKGIGGLFATRAISDDQSVQEAYRKFQLGRANGYLKYLDSKLEGRDYLMGKQFTVADAYAFVVTGWTEDLEIPLSPYKNVQSYLKRVAARPAVAKVLKQEGLV